jgi:transcriptional regulator with XRE-family HTH domain
VPIGARLNMRDKMLSISQERLGTALGVTFRQVQKYKKSSNHINASKLQQITSVLQGTTSFFFDGQTQLPCVGMTDAQSPTDVTDFVASADGLAHARALMRIKDAKMRQRIVPLVADMVGD